MKMALLKFFSTDTQKNVPTTTSQPIRGKLLLYETERRQEGFNKANKIELTDKRSLIQYFYWNLSLIGDFNKTKFL